MRNFTTLWKRYKYDFFVLLLYCCTIVFLITNYAYLDIKDHNLLLIEYLNSGYFPFPPGYYSLIYAVDLLIRVKYPFVASAALVLTFFFWWKYKLVFSWIRQELAVSLKQAFLLTLGLSIMSPVFIPWIDGESWYLGKFTATTWHNSTLITVFPFSILLLKSALDWFSKPTRLQGKKIIGLGILVALIKPSFLFCFIPAFSLFALFKEKKINKSVLTASGISALLFLVILIEKLLIFNWDPMKEQLYTLSEQSQVVIAPMKVWLYFSDQPIFDFISSFPLLLTFLFFWKKNAFKSDFFTFSLLNLFFALLVYAIFSETGFREYHGNFYWQIPIAIFLNSLSICFIVLKEFQESPKPSLIKYYILFGFFFLQAILGVVYWLRIFLGGTLS